MNDHGHYSYKTVEGEEVKISFSDRSMLIRSQSYPVRRTDLTEDKGTVTNYNTDVSL